MKVCQYSILSLVDKQPTFQCKANPKLNMYHSQFINRCTVPNCYVCKYYKQEYFKND